MKIQDVPFCAVDWSTIKPTMHPGVTGEAHWRTFETGNIRVRMVEYSPGYLADHWCSKGHIIHVLEGEIHTELSDGRVMITKAGGSVVVGDGTDPHRSFTETGVKLLIID
jgi:quercetin dioxygenase-like cupin family protein